MSLRRSLASGAIALALTGCSSQLVDHPSATVGGTPPPTAPVVSADAAGPGPAPGFECHDRPYPYPSGLTTRADVMDGSVVQGEVDIYCDTIAQVPTSQISSLLLYRSEGGKMTQSGHAESSELPGVGPAFVQAYEVTAHCEPGTWWFSYLLKGTASDGRPFLYGPIISKRVITECPI